MKLAISYRISAYIRYSLFFIITITAIPSWAFTLNISATSTEVTFSNAVSSSGTQGYVLTDWTPISGLPTTTEWIPGTFATKVASSVNLSGPSGNVTLPITMKGVEYNWSSSNATIASNTSSIGTICSIDSLGGSIGTVANEDGSPCVSGNKLINVTSINPFYFIRPIVYFDKAQLLTLLSGKEMGTYTGTVPLVIKYYYRSSGGALTYYLISQSISFVIDYAPANLTNITVSGSGVISPIYNTSDHTVSGSTDFDITATGYFSNGLKLKFENRSYVMTNMNDSNYTLPYSIHCNACQDSQIVNNGVIQISNPYETLIPGNNVTNLNFQLTVSYPDTSIEDIDTGQYSDVFTVIFTENL